MVHKRLHAFDQTPRPSMRKPTSLVLAAAIIGAFILHGCDVETNPLAPYQGQRPLTILRVTQSFTPDVQWVGGRVAAVGVNRGDRAALDSTLVWLMTGDGDAIDSHVTVGTDTDAGTVEQYGGVAVDSLDDSENYTFWLATDEAMSAELADGSMNEFTFVDTTLAMSLVLNGIQRGGMDVDMRVVRDERLLGTRYIVEWTPETHAVRRVAVRAGQASPSFSDLIWHILVPDGEPPSITSPLVIGTHPEGTDLVQEFPESGFQPVVHTLWMADDSWNGSFGLRAAGLAYLQLTASNFND